MTLQINTNAASLNARRHLDSNSNPLMTSLQRLSSGLRINSARDDAAGLSISDGFTSEIRGLNQGARNANDAISMLQVGEGALGEVTELLQRIRELSVQAANDGALLQQDKNSLQAEVNQLLGEIDRISSATRFGSRLLFAGKLGSISDPVLQPIVDGLKSYWLREAEDRVKTYYGLSASGGPDLDVVLYHGGAGGVLAFVSSSYAGPNLVGQSLNLDIDDFVPPNLPNGGNPPFYNDRIIAHEMVHAFMARTMNLPALRNDTNDNGAGGTVGGWFTEGTAEFIHGGDERLLSDLSTIDGNNADPIVAADYDALVAKLGNDDEPGIYAAGYAATAYLHNQFKAQRGTGIDEVMSYLSANPTLSLGDALFALGDLWGGGSAAGALNAFETDFKGVNGSAFVQSMNLLNADTGAIGGFDADGGPVLTAASVLPNQGPYEDNPTALNVVFPNVSGTVSGETIGFQVGAHANEEISISFGGFSTVNLSLSNLNVATDPASAMLAIDRAISYVDSSRGSMGAAQNRLLSTISNLGNVAENVSAARSRIQDADYAAETASLVQHQIVQQAAISVLAQANRSPAAVLSLLS